MRPPRSVRPALARPGVALAGLVALGGCAAFDSARSPDVVYSASSEGAKRLEVPPDLTGVSEAEQFVLPGDVGGPVTRNTLLPEFDSVRLVREGDTAHLAFDGGPETLWPRLLEFLAADGWAVDRTEPVAGILATRWRTADGAERPGALGRLIGGGDARSRVAFRLERDGDGGSRLYARRQLADAEAVEAGTAPDWPPASGRSEATDALLARLLAFLGVEAQASRGLIDPAAAREVLEAATVNTGGAGTRLVVHRGYRSAWEAVNAAVEAEGLEVDDRDDSVGRIVVRAPGTAEGGEASDNPRLALNLVPVHVSAVRVEIVDVDGRRLAAARERGLLERLGEAIRAGERVAGRTGGARDA